MDDNFLTQSLKRRDFLKSLGIGVGAVAIGNPQWLYGQAGKNILIGALSPARPIYDLARYVASELILKPEMGITIKAKTIRGFVPALAAMVRGEVNYSHQTLPSLIRAIKEKFPVKGFLDFAQQFIFYVVARPDIPSLDDLIARIKQGAKSGKKIKITTQGPVTAGQISLLTILRMKGVNPKTEVEIVFLPGTPRRLAALKAKSVDAAVIFPSRAIENTMRGEVSILAKFSDIAPKQSVLTWTATEETLSKRPKEVQLFTNAMVRAYREMYKRDLDELADFAVSQKPWRKFKPVKAVRETIKAAREMELWPVNGGVTRESVTTAQKFLVEVKFMKPDAVLPVDQIVTFKFREQALKELGPA